MRGLGAMLMGRTIVPAALVEVVGGSGAVTSWRPDAGAARIGDVACLMRYASPGSGWTDRGIFYSRRLSEADVSTTFTFPSGSVIIVLRNVSDMTLKLSGSVVTSTDLGSFTRSDRHCGILIANDINPDSLATSPAVSVGGISTASAARYFSPPTEGGTTRNLYPYLQPTYPAYASGASITASGRSGYAAAVRVYELIGG